MVQYYPMLTIFGLNLVESSMFRWNIATDIDFFHSKIFYQA